MSERLGSEYRGWARCAHSDEEEQALVDEGYLHLDTEALLWQLGWGGTVTCFADQWVLVQVRGVINDENFETSIQGDTFRYALTETLHIWNQKYFEMTGKPRWEDLPRGPK